MTNNNTEKKPDNVILFPGVEAIKEPLLAPQIREMLTNDRMDDIEETVDDLLHLIIECLAQGGIFFNTATDNTYVKDLALNMEALRSLLCKYYDLPHPLQQVSQNIFTDLGGGKVKYTMAENNEPESTDDAPKTDS